VHLLIVTAFQFQLLAHRLHIFSKIAVHQLHVAPSLPTDWQLHKKYCKRLHFIKLSEVQDWDLSSRKASPGESELFNTALAAAKATGDLGDLAYVQMAPRAAEHFVKVLLCLCVWACSGRCSSHTRPLPQQHHLMIPSHGMSQDFLVGIFWNVGLKHEH
jgi:hypothetical protein